MARAAFMPEHEYSSVFMRSETRSIHSICIFLNEKKNHAQYVFGMIFKVGVEDNGDFTICFAESRLNGFSFSHVLRVVKKFPGYVFAFQGEFFFKLFQNVGSIVSGAVIDDNYLYSLKIRAFIQDKQSAQAFRDQILFVENGYEYAKGCFFLVHHVFFIVMMG